MSIEELINRVKAQQQAMGYTTMIECSEDLRWSYIRDITLALVKEAAEFLDEIPWKPWMPIEAQPCDKEKAVKEICDIFVFNTVLFLSLGTDLNLNDLLEKTLNKVDNRIKNGYGKQEK